MDTSAGARWLPVKPEGLPRRFSRRDRPGFSIQGAMLAIPLLLLACVLLLRSHQSAQPMWIGSGNLPSYGSLLITVFTAFWFFRYTRAPRQTTEPERRPHWAVAEFTIRVGSSATGPGIALLDGPGHPAGGTGRAGFVRVAPVPDEHGVGGGCSGRYRLTFRGRP